jgi:hypothetical protein
MFDAKNEALKDMIQGHMAMDIEVAIKTSAGTPVKTGAMKADVRHFKSARNKWRVEADKAYSAYQERGARQDGSHVVKHYTTPGTSAGWFKRAIDSVVKNRDAYIMEARKSMGL